MAYTIDLTQTKFERGIASPQDLPIWFTQHPQGGIAFCGRSNVGKSSLINAIWGNKTAQTSKQPGRTQQINVFSFWLRPLQGGKNKGPYYLYDLPGYGFAQVSKEMQQNWQALITTFFQQAGPHVLMANLRDGRHPQEKADLLFEKMCTGLIQPIIVVFNKMDKLRTQKELAAFQKDHQAIQARFVVQGYFEVSATEKMKTKELSQYITAYLPETDLP
jgi:GTP-binding protein